MHGNQVTVSAQQILLCFAYKGQNMTNISHSYKIVKSISKHEISQGNDT